MVIHYIFIVIHLIVISWIADKFNTRLMEVAKLNRIYDYPNSKKIRFMMK